MSAIISEIFPFKIFHQEDWRRILKSFTMPMNGGYSKNSIASERRTFAFLVISMPRQALQTKLERNGPDRHRSYTTMKQVRYRLSRISRVFIQKFTYHSNIL